MICFCACEACISGKEALDGRLGDLKGAGEDTFSEKKAAFEETAGKLTSDYENLLGMIQ